MRKSFIIILLGVVNVILFLRVVTTHPATHPATDSLPRFKKAAYDALILSSQYGFHAARNGQTEADVTNQIASMYSPLFK